MIVSTPTLSSPVHCLVRSQSEGTRLEAGQERSTGQPGGTRELAGFADEGYAPKVRQPKPGETQLSWAEVHFALAQGVL